MQRTLAILKPDCLRKKLIGPVLQRIEGAEFRIVTLKMMRLSRLVAGEFYREHKGKGFYHDLLDFMTSGPCVVAVLEKENAIQDYRALMGATNPANAAEGTIRKAFADNVQENIVHGSDSPESAVREIGFFFSESELI